MSTIDAAVSFRCDKQLKADTQEALDGLHVKLSDVLRDTMQYIAENKRLPVSRRVISDEDADLLDIVRRRAAKPRKTSGAITLAELAARHDD